MNTSPAVLGLMFRGEASGSMPREKRMHVARQAVAISRMDVSQAFTERFCRPAEPPPRKWWCESLHPLVRIAPLPGANRSTPACQIMVKSCGNELDIKNAKIGGVRESNRFK